VPTLLLVLPDDLNRSSALLRDADPEADVVVMAEPGVETGFIPGGPSVHKRRIAYQLAAMRHFAAELSQRGLALHYYPIDGTHPVRGAQTRGSGRDSDREDPFVAAVADAIAEFRPQRLRVTRPGEHSLIARLESVCREHEAELEVLEDEHFLTTPDYFARFMEGRKSPLLETFYRRIRRRENVLMKPDGTPEGEAWNFDGENRRSFGRSGPDSVPAQPRFDHDATSRDVVEMVENRFADHPGQDAAFDLPVTPRQAEEALTDFIAHRLPRFGAVQDAMWTGEPFLFHSRLSAPLNLKLLDPRRVATAAEEAYQTGAAPLNAVEGFVRQIIGWREYVRGVYVHYMPEYARRNALDASNPLPPLYWNGETRMRCLAEVITGLQQFGYAHHIQRLMVAGLFAMLYGARPEELNAWHIAMYIDAFDWVSVPNTVGMSLHADGGIVGTKPYAATGKYINRMSNYCAHCPFDPDAAVGENACPYTTLYWTFLERHEERFRGNRRMTFQLKNLERKDEAERAAMRERAEQIRARASAGTL
jgi:deoxyribodipyrimidine photolyase-related protein